MTMNNPDYRNLVTGATPGQGSTPRQRRQPRERVQDVAISEASGIALGPDGYPHPLEVNESNELKVAAGGIETLLSELLTEIRLLRLGMVHADLIDPVGIPEED